MATAHRKLMDSGVAAPLAIGSSSSWNTADATASTYNITLPSGIVSGNLLLMFFSKSNATDDLTNTGWTRLATSNLDSEFKVIFGRIADGTEGSTATFSVTTAARAAANVYRITGNRNGLTSSEIAVSSVVNSGGNATTANPPNLTPSWGSAENLWFAVALINDSATGAFISYSANYSLGQIFNAHGSSSNSQAIASCARLLTASSEDPGPLTWTTARRSDAYTVAVRPQ